MTTGKELIRTQAARKGWAALGGGVGTILLVMLTLSLPVVPWVVAVGGTAYTARKAYEWLRFRGEWGLKF